MAADRTLGALEHAGEVAAAGRNLRQGLRTGPEILVRIGQIDPLADQADGKAPHAPALADAGIAIFAVLSFVQHFTLRRWHESALDRET